ncbi:hypothetical protein VOLCADRAFT_104598 [Volvox carteri f. nagariensis]|uniref:HotDog ACOT-type domain-containing protein n=1 Tax=Volvox carteri f. nagariensis TaxID=3068 RepID=D8TUR7_VOLCA|nr:uncharacterized protein VOLCADRAFT_104598 [Volvox carteri f. nagariensis]EFJ48871.1 hypothetical protein VOLCADRAFT_104598 [Volvox carteri f. nagariensis]|eukprot:XP_002950203.1 hypothetical protein VOLCADRAFT_104598 [Volvox carteri f. nagariensis]
MNPIQEKGLKGPADYCTCSEIAELRQRVARLETLLQAVLATIPTVLRQDTLLSAAATADAVVDADAIIANAALLTDGSTPPPGAMRPAAEHPRHQHQQQQLTVAAEQLLRDPGDVRPSGGAAAATDSLLKADAATTTPLPPVAAAPPSTAPDDGGATTVPATAAVPATHRHLHGVAYTTSPPVAADSDPILDPTTVVVPAATAAAGPKSGSGSRFGTIGTRAEASGLGGDLSLGRGVGSGVLRGGAGGGSGGVGDGGGVGICVAMAATRVVMHQLVLPADVNQLGICTGGQVLSWIDVCAGLSAKTLVHGPCVTASVDAVHFLRPCRLGCVVIIAAMVSRTFNTSLEVAVVVESEDMRTGVRHHCCSAHLTFVVRPRTDTATPGFAVGLPRVYPTTPEHRAMWEGAEVRRQQRLERRTRVRRNPELREAERVCRLQPITHREGGPTLPPAVTLPQPNNHHNHHNDRSSPARRSPRIHAGGGAPAVVAEEVERVASLPVPPPPPYRQGVNPGCTTAYMTQSILPQHANTLNITFGGQVMSWMEQCAYISASRLRSPALLTAAMDSVSFVKPTRVGDILYITAQVTAIFGSSLEVMVSVFGESPYAGAGSSAVKAAEAAAAAAEGPNGGGGEEGGGIFHCADAFVTVVAVDERHGSPVTVPFELDPQEPPDLLRYQGAVARRAERLALRGEFTAAEGTRLSLDGSHPYSPPPERAAGAADDSDGGGVLDAIPPL